MNVSDAFCVNGTTLNIGVFLLPIASDYQINGLISTIISTPGYIDVKKHHC